MTLPRLTYGDSRHFQVSIGLGASVAMSIIAIHIALSTKRRQPIVDEFDPMQLVWVVGTNPSLTRQIAEVEVPSSDHLRRAGLVDLGTPGPSHAVALRLQTDYHWLGQDEHESKGHGESSVQSLE
ncbi:hypothetical protein DAEQUDRAFT_526772 [Daedalea quercina L-15889]|uniref:Uncharacterized protein n=1 Tax=Daedalea quercina L-15889 TaxID=1314783 RepID=A0A165M9I2_9APHY|nr:hypothetical protein DAEQUDRAFT_526772 [Daedalea quercina L-15889]